MGWNLFGKSVTDEDICFLRDVALLIIDLSKYTSDAAISRVIPKILKEKGLYEKFKTLDSYTTINDCYPRDQLKKMDNINTLIFIASQFNLNKDEKFNITHLLFEIVKKNNLTNNEKIFFLRYLMKNFIYKDEKISENDMNMVIELYIDLI